ncbi:MAG: hypothetical protein V3T83_08720, partial [Acidobacteriota bacterium]
FGEELLFNLTCSPQLHQSLKRQALSAATRRGALSNAESRGAASVRRTLGSLGLSSRLRSRIRS